MTRRVSRRTTTPEALSTAPGARALRLELRSLIESKWAPRMTREEVTEPGTRTMMDGCLNLVWVNSETVMAGLAAEIDLAWLESQVAASTP
jgi:hypothetical protein